MAAKNTISLIAESLAYAVEPVEIALTSPELFEAFMQRLGWRCSGYIASVQNLGSIATALSQLARDGLDAANAARAIGLLATFFDTINDLSATTGLPETIDAGEFTSDFPGQLTDYLIANYLLMQRPVLGAVLLAGGIIKRARVPAAGKRLSYERLDIAWKTLGNLLNDARSTLRDAYGWGTPTFAQQSFVDNMVTLGEALGCKVYPRTIGQSLKSRLNEGALSTTPFQDAHLRWMLFGSSVGPAAVELGMDLFLLPPTATALPGVAVAPYAKGLADGELDITDTFSFGWKAGFDFSKGVLVSFRPGQHVSLDIDPLSATPGIGGNFSTTFRLHGAAAGSVTLLGSEDGSRFAYRSLDLTLGARQDKTGPAFYVEGAITNGEIVISRGEDTDGFIANILPSDITLPASLTIGFDSQKGVYLGGTGRLEATIPLHIGHGPLQITAATISVKPKDAAVPVAFGATFNASLGPIVAVVNNVGLLADLSFPGKGGNIGPIDAALRFKPPSGIGVSIDAKGVLTGGGFLFHDAAADLYAGVMQLSLHERITLKAFGLIATRMPDGSKGYSLIVFITAEDFKPIPLGLGITLQGIGGMLAINRTFNETAMREGLKNNTLGTLLFPKDPIRNAPEIIRNLAVVFPAKQGSYLLGVLVKLGWFSPTLVTLDLALIFEFGSRQRLIALGRIQSLLPSRDNALIQLNLDALGLIDFDEGKVEIDAVLVDSRLAHKFALTGSMALRARWKAGPGAGFALAIGGFNPRFAPPPGMPKLDRIAIALAAGDNPRLTCEAYFAITSNTIQFGAHAELYAAAFGFNVQGNIGFDVLIVLAPFHFLAEFHASLQLKRGSRNLFKVSLAGALEGPRPLRVSGKASFEIFWCDFSIRFDKTLVSGEKPPLPPAVDVLAELRRALGDRASWSTQLPAHRQHGVSLRKLVPGTGVVLDPLGNLVVKQQVVPLNTARDIDTFGGAPPAGARRFQVGATLAGGMQQVNFVKEGFAPAQFFAMSDDEKIASPSFVDMDAGLVFGSDAVVFAPAQAVASPLEYETVVIDDDAPPNAPPAERYPLHPERLLQHARFGAVARAPIRNLGLNRFRTPDAPQAAELRTPNWVIASVDDARIVAAESRPDPTWNANHATMLKLNQQAGGARRWQLMPEHEVAP